MGNGKGVALGYTGEPVGPEPEPYTVYFNKTLKKDFLETFFYKVRSFKSSFYSKL
jgi:hypothetical protein